MRSAVCADETLANCSGLWDNKCFAMTDEEVDKYPPLVFELAGTGLEMSPRDYLLLGSPIAGGPTQYCLGIRNAGFTGFIIGMTTMKNYYVVFDYAQTRIGWGKVNKNTCGSMNSNSVPS